MKDMSIVSSFFEDHTMVYKIQWARCFRRLPTQNDRDAYKLSSSLYNNMKAMELIRAYQDKYQFMYDIVIKFRADIISDYVVPILPLSNITTNTIYIPEGHDWHFYDQLGINDHIAYGSFTTMQIYSNVFANIELYCGHPHNHGYHPESLLLYHLLMSKVNIIRFPFQYGHNTNRHEPGEYG